MSKNDAFQSALDGRIIIAKTANQMQAERDEARSVAKHLREMLLDLTKRYAGPFAPPPPPLPW